jgi:hypothetical protein
MGNLAEYGSGERCGVQMLHGAGKTWLNVGWRSSTPQPRLLTFVERGTGSRRPRETAPVPGYPGGHGIGRSRYAGTFSKAGHPPRCCCSCQRTSNLSP